jgi:DMSO/TMAO reductase YedYZ molybdopterin-dependent catalytic subunit
LTIDGLVKGKRSFTLAQLEKEFKKTEIVAAMQVCLVNIVLMMND